MRNKLSRRHKNKEADEAEETAPPATTATTSAPKQASSKGQAALPTVTDNLPTTSVQSVIASAKPIVAEATTSNTYDTSGMSKLGGPQQPKANDGGSGSQRYTRKDRDKDDDDDDRGGGIVNALRGGGKGGRGLVDPLAGLPPVGSYNPRQVLAVNLSDAGRKRAADLKFQVRGTKQVPLMRATITVLEAPSDANVVSSVTKLEEAIPDSAFTLNRVYVPYRLGASSSGGGNPLKPGKACDPDRCFAASLINWRPALASCAQGVKIGIIDTGVDKTHPAIPPENKGAFFEDFVPKGKPSASRDHGTGVLSVLGGRPESSTPGLAPHATYFVANAFFAEAKGGPAMSESVNMIEALDWLDRSKVQIINLSFSGPRDELVHTAIQRLEAKGVIVVAAAGNDGPSAPPTFPAAYQEVVAVTAVDRNLAPYRYANRGDHISISAPGVGIWTAMADLREGPQTGTSFAAPHVTAVLALNHSRIERMDETLSPKERAMEVLNSSAMKLGGPKDTRTFGAGLVRAPDGCPPPGAPAVAEKAPAVAAAREPVVVRASTVPLLDWFKSTTVRAATGN